MKSALSPWGVGLAAAVALVGCQDSFLQDLPEPLPPRTSCNPVGSATGIALEYDPNANTIGVRWDGSSILGHTGYAIERRLNDDPWAPVDSAADLDVDAALLQDTAVPEDTVVRYRVAGVRFEADEKCQGSFVESEALLTKPRPVTAVEQSLGANGTDVVLSWTDDNDVAQAVSYRIERAEFAGEFAEVSSDASSPFFDTDTSLDMAYTYRVVAVSSRPDATYPSAPASSSSIWTAPKPVEGLSVASVASSNAGVTTLAVSLSWTDPNSNAQVEGRALEYEITQQLAGGIPSSFEVASTSATIPGAVFEGQYEYTVTVRSGDSLSSTQVAASLLTMPRQPQGLQAVAVAADQVQLTWSDNNNAEGSFQVLRKAPGAAAQYGLVATVAGNGVSAADVEFVDTSVEADSDYVYAVAAANGGGESLVTDVGNGSRVWPEDSARTFPAAPAELSVTAVDQVSVRVSWVDPGGLHAGLALQRRPGGTAEYQDLVDLPAGATSYLDAGLEADTSYDYRLRADNGATVFIESNGQATAVEQVVGGWSEFSDASGSTLAPPPVDMSVEASLDGTVTLQWLSNAANRTGFLIERSPWGAEQFSVVAEVADVAQMEFIDNTANPDTHYDYRVSVVNPGGVSEALSASIWTRPVAVGDLVAVSDSTTQVTLSWTNPNPNAVGYRVARARLDSAEDPTEWTVEGAATLQWVDTSVVAEGRYVYTVFALNSGEPSPGAEVEATALANAPTNLAAAAASPLALTLTWVDTNQAEAGYTVYRSLAGEDSYAEVGQVGADASSFDDTVVAHQGYDYRVAARNAGGESLRAELNAVYSRPAVPAAFDVTLDEVGAAVTTWSIPDTDGIVALVLERAVADSDEYTVVAADLGSDMVTYTDSTVVTDTRYRFRLWASGEGGVGEPTPDASVITLPNPVADLAGSSTGPGAVELTWADANTLETGYRIERSIRDAEDYSLLATLEEADVTAYTDSTTAAETLYDYRVTVVNPGGETSAVVTAGTPLPASTGFTATPTYPDLVVADDTPSRDQATGMLLQWQDASALESGYLVEHSLDGVVYSPIAQLDADTLEYSHTEALQNTHHYYRLTTLSGSTLGGQVLVEGDTYIFVDVRTVTGSAGINHRVRWYSPPDPQATKYIISRRLAGDEVWQQLTEGALDEGGIVGNNHCSSGGVSCTHRYDHPWETHSTDWEYLIQAVNVAGTCPGSIVARRSPPVPPSDYTVTRTGPTSVHLSWTDNSDAETQYKVERFGVNPWRAWTTLAELPPNTVEFVDDAGDWGVWRYSLRIEDEQNSTPQSVDVSLNPLLLYWDGDVAASDVSGACVVTSPGRYTVGDAADLVSSSGVVNISDASVGLASGVASDENGVSATLDLARPGRLQFDWSAEDTFEITDSISRLVSARGTVATTAYDSPAATIADGHMTGMQLWAASEEPTSVNACDGCIGRRGGLAVGNGFGCVLTYEGKVRCWGAGSTNRLGNGSTSTTTSLPTEVCAAGTSAAGGACSTSAMENVVAISTFDNYTCALLDSGLAKCWGPEWCYRLGNGATPDCVNFGGGPLQPTYLVPTTVCASGTGDDGTRPDCGTGQPLDDLAAIEAGLNGGCALKDNGEVYCWGSSDKGFAGAFSSSGQGVRYPRKINGIGTAVAISVGRGTAYAINTAGELVSWGSNKFAARGWGNVDDSGASSGGNVCLNGDDCATGILDGAVQVAAGHSYVCVLRTDGLLWCWGDNSNSKRGPGAAERVPSPIVGLNSVEGFTLGQSHTCAVVSGGEVRCVGKNDLGQLGHGTTGDPDPTPRSVCRTGSWAAGNCVPLTDVVAIDAGSHATCALVASGEVYCWGDNSVFGAGQPVAGGIPTAKPLCVSSTQTACDAGTADYLDAAVRTCGNLEFSDVQ